MKKVLFWIDEVSLDRLRAMAREQSAIEGEKVTVSMLIRNGIKLVLNGDCDKKENTIDDE